MVFIYQITFKNMKTKVSLLTGIVVYLLAFLIGCDSNNDITPNQKWEEVQPMYVESSDCLNKSYNGWDDWKNWPNQEQKYERIQIVSYDNKNEVSFTHHNTLLNCEAEIKVEIKVEGNTIFINEKDTAATSAKCECPYRLLYNVILEKDGIYSIKLNDEEAFDFTFKASEYSNITVNLRPYEGPDYYDDRLIWDFNCYDINFAVTDSKGNDLLNPEYAGNILKNNITITYNNQTFKYNYVELRYNMPYPLAIRKVYNEYLNKNLLTFGEFTPADNFKNETFTIDWGDGTKDVVTFDLYIEWPNIYTPKVYQKLYLNEEEVSTENYTFMINLVK